MDDAEAYRICRDHSRDRADALPSAVWECDICGGRMKLRSSHLNRDVMADDLKFKCMDCWHVRRHGVPFTDPKAFHAEAERRPGTIVDFGLNSGRETPDAAERLEALGYLAKAEEIR